MTTKAPSEAFTLKPDPDIAGAFIVVANDDGELLGFGDTEAEALAGAREAAAARHEGAAFRRFSAAMTDAIERVGGKA